MKKTSVFTLKTTIYPPKIAKSDLPSKRLYDLSPPYPPLLTST